MCLALTVSHPLLPSLPSLSQWLNAKSKRMTMEEKTQSALNKTIEKELEFINSK